MNNIFITRIDSTNHLINQMELSSSQSALYYICLILFFLILISFVAGRRKTVIHPQYNTSFIVETSYVLKGIAIILLILGHASQQCVVGSEALPFRITGNAAVIIFLFVSGIGLAKKYNMQVDRYFWVNRIKKIAVPLWLSLALIVPLNLLLINHTDPIEQLVLNISGVFWTKFPNSPCWFITYILFLYATYFIASLIPVKRSFKITVLFILPMIVSWFIIETGSVDHFKLWPQYSIVFPVGVGCGLYATQLRKWNDTFIGSSPILYWCCMLIFIGLFGIGRGVYWLSHLVSSQLYHRLIFALVNPVPLIIFIILFTGWLENHGWHSSMLQILGKYSFEMYLYHFPFLVYYDFLLFRKPLEFYFFVYFLAILLISILFQRVSSHMTSLVFDKRNIGLQ